MNKDIKKNFSKKELMNLIETNLQIYATSHHSVSSNSSFKIHLNAKSFNMFLTSSTISTEASFINDSIEETLNVNKTCWQ